VSPPAISWYKTFGGLDDDYAWSVKQTTDGGYVLAGYGPNYDEWEDPTQPPPRDAYLIKTDAEGNKQWQKYYGGTGFDSAYSVQQTKDGGFIFVGYSVFSYGEDEDVYLVKTDVDGDEQWYKTFDISKGDQAYSVQQTSDGGYIIAGRTSIRGQLDALLIKVNAQGTEEWHKTFGGELFDEFYSVQQTTDGGYIIAGYTKSYGYEREYVSEGDKNIYLVKTDSQGNEQWHKTFGGPHDDDARSVQQTADGGYIIAGITFNKYDDAYLIKTDAKGNEQWHNTYGGSKTDQASAVQQTSDGGYIVVGYTVSYGNGNDAYLVKTDALGNEQWYKTLGGVRLDTGFSVQQTSDGGYIIAGVTESYGEGRKDAWLIKIDAERK